MKPNSASHPLVIKGKLSFFFCSVLCNPESSCLMAAVMSQHSPRSSLGAAMSLSVVSPRQVGAGREQEQRVGAAGLSCSPSFEGPTSSHALVLAAHTGVSCADLYWHPTLPMLARCGDAVPCCLGELWCPLLTAMAPTKVLCALRDRPVPLLLLFEVHIPYLAQWGQDKQNRGAI